MNSQFRYDWSEYKKRQLTFILVLFTFIPAVYVSEWLGSATISIAPVIFYFAWGLFVFIPMGMRYIRTPCPRCKNPILFKMGFGYPFGLKCLHCGLKIKSQDAD